MSEKIVIARNFPDYYGNTDHLGYEVTIGKLSNEQLLEIVELLESKDLNSYLDSEYFLQFYDYNELYHGNGILGEYAGLTPEGAKYMDCDDKDHLSTDNWEFDNDGATNTREVKINDDVIIVTFQAEDKYFCVEQEIEDNDLSLKIPIKLQVDNFERLSNFDWAYLEEDIDIRPKSLLVGATSQYGDFDIDYDNWEGDESKYTKYQFIMHGDNIIFAVSNRGMEHWNGDTIDFVCDPFGENELCPANFDEEKLDEFINEIKKAIKTKADLKVEKPSEDNKETNIKSNIKKAWDEDGETINKLIEKYNYQPTLTKKLDNIKNGLIDEKTLLEIFLWKTDRYPDLDSIDFIKLNNLNNVKFDNFRECEDVLRDLISIKGFGLAMASTILRFRNPSVFPIIDRRAYRVLMEEDKLAIHHATSIDKQIEIYFNYVEKVHQFVKEKGVDLSIVDRVLYIFDKEANKGTKI